jgi:hypothetical protein
MEQGMTSDARAPRYEIRDGRLYVNGERQTVTVGTAQAAVALYRVEEKDPVGLEEGKTTPISEELGRLILSMESRKAVRALAHELGALPAA